MTILVVAEHRRGELRAVSLEAISVGRSLANTAGVELHVAIIGGNVTKHAEMLNREGVDAIHAIPEGEEFNHDIYLEAVSTITAQSNPSLIIIPHTVNGLDYAPAVASRLDWPLLPDVIDVDQDDSIIASREMFGSKVISTVESPTPAVITIRPGEWPPADGSGDAEIHELSLTIDEEAIRSTVTGFQEVAGGDVDITEADVLVSVGRGIGEEENLELIENLATALGATVSASRPIIDNGWLPKNRQVGQSGKTVAPDIYIAIGISGAVQHVAGIKNVDTVIAINVDPDAPIFDIADIGIVGDLFDVVPALIDAVS